MAGMPRDGSSSRHVREDLVTMSFNILKFNSMKELEDYYFTKLGGLGGNLLRKADSPTLSNSAGWLNAIYGKKVWSQLNMEANVFALLPKEPWTQSGLRFKTLRATTDGSTEQSNGLGGKDAEGLSALPDTLQPVYAQKKIMPKTIWHGFNTSELGDFLSQIDDAIDLLPQLRQDIGEHHAFQINHMLLKDVDTPAADNMESVDRICANSSEDANHNDVSDDSDLDLWYQHGARGTSALDRSANTWSYAQSSVSSAASQADRTLTLAIIDTNLQNIWENGGKPKVVITGYDTLMRWQQLLEAERRYMQSARVIPTFGGVQGAAPGVEAGFMVATYHGIPIIPSQAVTKDTISRIYSLDTDYLKVRVAKPTRYLESRDIFALDALEIEGAYETMGEVICQVCAAQGKIRDLK